MPFRCEHLGGFWLAAGSRSLRLRSLPGSAPDQSTAMPTLRADGTSHSELPRDVRGRAVLRDPTTRRSDRAAAGGESANGGTPRECEKGAPSGDGSGATPPRLRTRSPGQSSTWERQSQCLPEAYAEEGASGSTGTTTIGGRAGSPGSTSTRQHPGLDCGGVEDHSQEEESAGSWITEDDGQSGLDRVGGPPPLACNVMKSTCSRLRTYLWKKLLCRCG